MLSHPASNQSLPEGYVPYPGLGVAYKIYNASVSWSEAEQLCVDEGAKLAVIDSIQKLMYAKIQPMGRGVRHVGLRRVNQTWVSTTYGKFKTKMVTIFVTQSIFLDAEDVMLSIPWAANEPGPTDLEIGGLDFAMVGWANTFFGLISGNNSTFTGDYICELPIPGYVHLSYQLPEGYVAYRDIGVAYKAHAVQASWNMARKLCFLEGAQLAVIDTLPKLYYALDQQYYSWVRMHVGNIRVNYTWVSATDGKLKIY